MYLYEDAAKHARKKLFDNCGEDVYSFSSLCDVFDSKGIEIFSFGDSLYTENQTEDNKFKP